MKLANIISYWGRSALNWEKEPHEGADVVYVSSSGQLAEELTRAVPGRTIVLRDGTYDNAEAFTISVQGAIDAPVTVRAEHQGKAVITGGACFPVNESSYVILKGLTFTNTGKAAIDLHQCHHIRITRNTFALIEDGTELRWLLIRGADSHHQWIDHNDFGPRRDKGMYVSSNGGNGQMSRYDVYEYNYFHGSGPSFPRSEGEIKALRIGLSGVSMSDGFNIIQYNLFEHCDANPEIISLKSGRNEVRYNTFLNCEGHLTSRHGHFNKFFGNVFIGDGQRKGMGGFRIYANDHEIYDNDLVNLTDWAVNLDSGGFDGGPEGNIYTKEVLTAHWRLYRPRVYGNRIIGGPGIVVGSVKAYPPVDAKITENTYRSGDGVVVTVRAETGVTIDGNDSKKVDDIQDEAVQSLIKRKPLTREEVGPNAP